MFIESVMPSNHLILCHPLLLLPSIFPSIRVFSNESALHIRWTKYPLKKVKIEYKIYSKAVVQSLGLVLLLETRGLQHARFPCPLPTPRAYHQWCYPTISSSVIPFYSHLQSFPASGSFQMSQLFAWGGQSIGVSASTSVLPMNTQDWSPLGWTGWISL